MQYSSPDAQEYSATIFRREDRFVIHSQSETDTGLLIACAPFLVLPVEAENKALGEAVLTTDPFDERGIRTAAHA